MLVKFCNKCGHEIADELEFCPRCGAKYVDKELKTADISASLALGLGIVSILLGIINISIVVNYILGVILATAAIILGKIGNKDKRRYYGTVGLYLAVAGLICNFVLFLILFIGYFA